MRGNLTAHMARQYRKLGPAFRMRAPWRTYTVLAGLEANLFYQTKGRLHLRGFDTYLGLARELDGHRFVLSMDGREHFRLRKALRDGYSRASLESRIDQAAELAIRAVDQLPEGDAVPAMPFMQRLISSQLGELLAGISPGKYFDDLVFYFDRVLAVRVLRRLPGLMMRTPRMRRASARVHELYRLVVDAHAPQRREGKEPDLIDDVLALHRADPQFLPESELKSACLGPLIAGLHTAASVCACMLYCLLKHQDLMARARAEAHKLFTDEGPTAAKLRAMDVTHRVAMETLRMYHTAPAAIRTVVNGFEFAGYWIPAGTELLIATAVTHVCDEHFPAPRQFDIDRYLPERAEHRKPGAYAPFGLGHASVLGGCLCGEPDCAEHRCHPASRGDCHASTQSRTADRLLRDAGSQVPLQVQCGATLLRENPIMRSPATAKAHLFATAPVGVWARLVREHGGVPPRYWGRLAGDPGDKLRYRAASHSGEVAIRPTHGSDLHRPLARLHPRLLPQRNHSSPQPNGARPGLRLRVHIPSAGIAVLPDFARMARTHCGRTAALDTSDGQYACRPQPPAGGGTRPCGPDPAVTRPPALLPGPGDRNRRAHGGHAAQRGRDGRVGASPTSVCCARPRWPARGGGSC